MGISITINEIFFGRQLGTMASIWFEIGVIEYMFHYRRGIVRNNE